ncbi:lipocalin family protein [Spirosoma sp. KNUC1025]|uniref:lipocalin family protein n=1 Tax=Spirosoma sp. KNUC1025 TaxID=2894082 RepID=UPI0038678AFE|nr:lipocalin family protein [Spirosoma sp. KNUC1025]
MKTSFLILLIALVFTYASAQAQNVVGTWKRTAMLTTETNGKTTDELPELTKTMPCTADITYTFLADGTMRTDVPDACGPMKKTIEKMNKVGRWSATGNRLKIVVPDKSLPDSDYALSVTGTTMTWTFDYVANPQVPNPGNAKRLVIKYARL